ncbi:unnamed protein product [Porites lobata]|uniref:Androgen-induced gene 1 protein-like n=1 Tax=Porites lobata TaxID=104759 RepID=A0ABN8QTN9_9CNID|nr:unnamed protein product [Porites lobata]
MVAYRGLFHFGCGFFYIYGTYYDLQIVTAHSQSYGGRFKYLTFLNLLLQLIFFIIAPLADVLTFIRGREDNWLVRVRDLVFASLAFPISVFVATTFWGIYMIDRELIFPKALDKVIPSWINHVLHTWCAVLIIIEGAFIKHKYPKNRLGLGLLTFASVAYLLWITWIAYVAEFWVYPFLRAMPNNGRVVFFTLSFCIIVFFYFLGKWKTMFIWGGDNDANSTTNNGKPKDGVKKKVKKAD